MAAAGRPLLPDPSSAITAIVASKAVVEPDSNKQRHLDHRGAR